MRRRLPEGVKMYIGDDFNHPELAVRRMKALLALYGV